MIHVKLSNKSSNFEWEVWTSMSPRCSERPTFWNKFQMYDAFCNVFCRCWVLAQIGAERCIYIYIYGVSNVVWCGVVWCGVVKSPRLHATKWSAYNPTRPPILHVSFAEVEWLLDGCSALLVGAMSCSLLLWPALSSFGLGSLAVSCLWLRWKALVLSIVKHLSRIFLEPYLAASEA